MPDLTLVCCDCKAEFVFPEKDQKFFAEKGYANPKRCRPCIQLKKAARAADGGEQDRGDRNRGDRGGR